MLIKIDGKLSLGKVSGTLGIHRCLTGYFAALRQPGHFVKFRIASAIVSRLNRLRYLEAPSQKFLPPRNVPQVFN